MANFRRESKIPAQNPLHFPAKSRRGDVPLERVPCAHARRSGLCAPADNPTHLCYKSLMQQRAPAETAVTFDEFLIWSARQDTGRCIAHYLIINPEERLMIHHRRLPGASGDILTRILQSGQLQFDPPGIVISVDRILAAGTP
jgi:hypothetical protein